MTWLFARTQTGGGADVDAAASSRTISSCVPLSAAAQAGREAGRRPPAPAVDTGRSRANRSQRWTRRHSSRALAMLLANNPPAADDAPMRDKMKKFGIDRVVPST